MKRRDLEQQLKELGWRFKRHGKCHDVWINGKGDMESVPRHTEIKEILAEKILKNARLSPG